MKRINKTIVLFVFIFLMAISDRLYQSTLVKTNDLEPQLPAPEQTLNLYPFTGENALHGYIDSTGKIIIEPQFSAAFDFFEGLAAVIIDVFIEDQYRYQYGYIDPTGKVVIPPQFKRALPFSNGRAAVEIDGKMGYIDQTGKVVIPPQFDLTYSRSFSEGLAAVKVESGRRGYIDTMGQMVIPAQIFIAGDGDFHDGLAYVEASGPYSSDGFINKKGELAIALPLGGVRQYARFSEGLTVISKEAPWSIFTIFGQQGEEIKSGYMNTGGKIVIRPQFDRAKNFSEGLAEVGRNSARGEQQGQETVETKWGYIDKTGKRVIPEQFQETKAFSEGLAAVTEDGKKWGYIDRKGKIVIPMQFDAASSFKGELASVSTPERWGYINRTGNFVWFQNKI